MSHRPADDFLWWRDGVIYQIYPRSYSDSNDDGIGDLPGIASRIEYLADLGADAIWLSPIQTSPMFDFGYDVSDYENIDPMFGDLKDFDYLLDKAHQYGIHVVMDLVLNHTSHLHPWFLASRSSRSDSKRDWYLWRDPAPGKKPPNNWQSVFGGRAWEYDTKTGQYYYHQFLKQQPDLNWRNPEVRQRLYRVLRFWLDRGVDGFRLDVVHAYFKDALFRDNPGRLSGLRGFDRQVHIYDWDLPDNELALREIRAVLDEYTGRMAVGEVPSFDMAIRYVGTGKLHLAFNFEFLRQPWEPAAFWKTVQIYQDRMPKDAWPCFTLGNHDVERFPTRFDAGSSTDARTKVAATLLLTQRGTPFIYYGEEIGMRNTPIPRSEIQDPPGRRYWPFYRGRDPERTPMQWNSSKNAGFSMAKPWLRLNKDFLERNVANQDANPHSILNFYRRLLHLRRASVALRRGTFKLLTNPPSRALVYLRETPQETYLVALNFKDNQIMEKLDGQFADNDWDLSLSSVRSDHQRLQADRINLAPLEACLLRQKLKS